MTYKIDFSKKFRRDYKKIANKPIAHEVDKVIEQLAQDKSLEARHRDHALKGDFAGCRECHVRPYLLLVYKKQKDILLLTCVRLASHSDLFD